ncbi:BirA family biotin operon repressor/biotin-[acetyl-CoA-carboxylase] ligase [Glaciihabitans tibetensis]|uniref:biotin--[biotin carboxyl-carrier protein] ligase n=1 Tax=Glaciihabitans tibetensis TaxID=1266600 RepID=A0A2T0VFP2_9MICO|nr:biotin--[acetyl-CoA-carboxylase] ligase [Glaciihabitans tibetensis]PRY68874.1 BirA family biotin operon repressor/biotin-[acetyl-CoA-carboxylase] ligase [Glaciihabitans tibetensis]
MDLLRSAALATLVYEAESTSTNDDLLRLADDAAEFTVVATLSQTAGRGRLGRVWVAPPGQTLAASLLLKPRLRAGEPLAVEAFGWLPLLAGLAMTRSVGALLPHANVTLKWPNDVLIDGKKVAGLLAELLPSLAGVVIGSGVNLAIPASELPTPVSTSMGLHDHDGSLPEGEDLADQVLAAYLQAVRVLYDDYLRFGGDAEASGLLADVSEKCSSLGQQVRVELPGGVALFGVAIALDQSGRLLVKRSADGAVQAVAAGDVTHLRYE